MAKPYIRIVPIGPTTYLTLTQVFAGIDDAVAKTLDGQKKDLERTVETWDNKPKFETDGPRRVGDTIEGSVSTSDKRFLWVDRGVRPHSIDASPGQMHFQRGYRAKTRRRMLSSMAGGKTNTGPWHSPRMVDHPGIRAREFTDVVAKKWQAKFIREYGLDFGLWAKLTRALKGAVRL